ncbi:MAG: GAF domain-containing protein [Aggregatilineales bacterium]
MTGINRSGAATLPGVQQAGPLVRLIGGLVQVRYPYTDPLAAQRARGLLRLSLIIGLAALIGLVYVLATFDRQANDLIASTGLIGAIVGAGLTIMLVRRGRERSAGVVLVMVTTIGASVALFPYGYDNVGALALSIPLVLAGVLFGWGGALIVLGILLVTLFASTLALLTQLIVPVPLFTSGVTPLAVIVIGGLTLGADALILGAFAGISPRTWAGARLDTTDRRLIANIDQIIESYTSREDLIAHVGDDLRNLLGYYYIQLFAVGSNGALLIRPARIGAISTHTRAERRIALDDQQNVVAATFHTGQTRFIARDAPDSDRSEFLEATQSELLVPLRQGDRALGVLDVHSIRALAFETHDVELLELIAGRLATALRNLQTAAELRRTAAERLQLQEQVERLVHDLERLRRETNQQAWDEYLSGREPGRIGFDWAGGQTTPNTAVTSALAHAASDALPQIRMDGNDQVLSAPITVRGQLLGALVFRAVGESPWGEHSLELARLIGQRLALVLDNVRLLEQTQTAAVRERLINQIAVQLQAQPDMETLLATAAQSFSRALGASSARVQLVLPEHSELAVTPAADRTTANGTGDEL